MPYERGVRQDVDLKSERFCDGFGQQVTEENQGPTDQPVPLLLFRDLLGLSSRATTSHNYDLCPAQNDLLNWNSCFACSKGSDASAVM